MNDSYHIANYLCLNCHGRFHLTFSKWVALNVFVDSTFFMVDTVVYDTSFVFFVNFVVTKCRVIRVHG